jgi:hypothetical protein
MYITARPLGCEALCRKLLEEPRNKGHKSFDEALRQEKKLDSTIDEVLSLIYKLKAK